MFTAFIYTAAVLGLCSVYLVHLELKKRFKDSTAAGLIAGVLLVCSIAIYLGRDLRWNTWDLLVNLPGLLFDISDRLLDPLAHPQMFSTVGAFFLLLGSMYIVAWHLVRLLRSLPREQ
jgi:uncharacterized membrane protein